MSLREKTDDSQITQFVLERVLTTVFREGADFGDGNPAERGEMAVRPLPHLPCDVDGGIKRGGWV